MSQVGWGTEGDGQIDIHTYTQTNSQTNKNRQTNTDRQTQTNTKVINVALLLYPDLRPAPESRASAVRT